MRLPLLAVSMIGAGLLAAAAARAADMVPPEPPAAYEPPPAVVPPPVVVEPPPVVVERPVVVARPVDCWRHGLFGWERYPCFAGPPGYWHGDGYGYGWRPYRRPYWAGAHRWHRSDW
jgi:hypothetical protein